MRRPVEERFYDNVGPGDLDDCWEWMGRIDSAGYGHLRIRGSEFQAHRIAYAYWFGEIPERRPDGVALVVHQTCENRRCCNPSHLAMMTRREIGLAAIERRRLRNKIPGYIENLKADPEAMRVMGENVARELLAMDTR